MTVEERFWAKVDKTAGPEGCWLWTASLATNGYGRIRVDGRLLQAHRFSCVLAGREVPDELFGCHVCDNRRCVNPDHLWFGTALDNNQDAIAKGRAARGEAHGRSHLTVDAVRYIRGRLAAGAGQREMAREMGVSQCCIQKVAHRRTWAHV